MRTLIIFVLTLCFSQSFAQTKWALDKSHTNIKFTVTHMMISEVDGEFREFDATVTSTKDNFDGSEVEFIAKTASIDTGNERRDNHLKSDDFFNAEQFPELKFKGKIQKEGEKYYLVGDFTIRDVMKPVKFDVKYNGTINGGRGKKAGFKVMGTINRFDYNLKWDRMIEAGGGLVASKEIAITCNVELNEVKQ